MICARVQSSGKAILPTGTAGKTLRSVDGDSDEKLFGSSIILSTQLAVPN